MLSTQKNQKGAISILLTVLLLGIFLAIASAISVPTLKQVKMSRDTGQSVTAFYAANSGVEVVLYEIRKGTICDSGCNFEVYLTSNDGLPVYDVTYVDSPSKITSRGKFGSTVRTVFASW